MTGNLQDPALQLDTTLKAPTVPPHQTFLQDLRVRDWVLLIGLIVLLIALVIVESVNDAVAKYLSDHPLLTGVATALLLSAIAVGGLDALRAHWEAEKWRRLSSLALLSIANDITRVIDAFIWLVIGVKPVNSFSPSKAAHTELTIIRSREGLPVTHDPDFSKVEFGDYSSLLDRLVDDREWLLLANLEIDRAKARHRRSIALWVPSMLLNPSTVKVLARVVAFNDFLSQIQARLRIHTDVLAPPSHEVLVDFWTKFLAEATSLREDLWATSRGRLSEWRDSRRLLPPEFQKELQSRDHEDVIDVVGRPFREALPDSPGRG